MARSARMAAIVRRFFPWVVIDLPLVWACYALALLVRGVTTDLEYAPALEFAVLASAVVVACNEAFGIYRRWWRFATSQDLVPLTVSVGSATVAVVGLNLAWPGFRPMPLSVVFLGSFFAISAMTAVRYRSKPLAAIRRTWRRLVAPPAIGVTRVLIVGAGDAGQHLGWQLRNGSLAESYHVVGHVDDDVRKHGMLIHGHKVHGGRAIIPEVVEREAVDLIVIAIHTISGRDFRDIVSICQETPAQIKVMPNAMAPIAGEPFQAPLAGGSLFGDLTFEDLLGRHSVAIDREQCRHLVRGKTVLVTGASGSIGSELCRQLADLSPGRLILFDSNESGLHDLTIELQGFRSDDTVLVPVVGDITHERRLRAIFAGERPRLVFHAAAYKHVPLMEQYPEEAVRVNVGGTRLLTQLAAEFGVETFVLVSTDKAVAPSNAYGATKRICELMVAAMAPSRTRFTVVRFGNVLTSRGSVVPTFAKQIDLGGPVTITDPEMSRYFMSISEAASLIVQAVNFTHGGDVFLLDMGEEMNIAELARRMIRLRGLRPDIDIPIVVTGARPGEKLREVLLSTDEHTQPTPHPQVLRILGLRQPMPPAELRLAIDDLNEVAANGDRDEIRRRLWAVARDGSAPPALPASALAGGALDRSTARSSIGWGGTPAPLKLAIAGALTAGAADVPVTEARAPIAVFAERVGEGLGRLADRFLALEPWYVVPAALALLLYPNPLVWPAVALVVLPWLVRLLRTGYPAVRTSFDLPIGLLGIGTVVGLAVTSSPAQGGIRASALLAAVALYWLIVHHATDIYRLRKALGAAIVACALGSALLLVVAAPYVPWGQPGGPADGFVTATDGFRQWVLSSDEVLQRYRLRASGLGGLATFGMALTIGPAVAAARRRTRLAMFALSLGFLALNLLSGSQSALISVLALLVVLIGLRYKVFLVAVPFVLAGLWAIAQRGVLGTDAPDALPLSVSFRFWQNAATLLHDFAFTGVGLGLRPVHDVYESYFMTIGPTFSHAHNAYVQAYLEQGLAGCVGLVTLTLVVAFNARRTVVTAKNPLVWSVAIAGGGAAIVLLFEGLTEVVLLTSGGTVMLLVALGLLVAAGRVNRGRNRPRPAVEHGLARLLRPVVAAPLAAGLLLIGLATFTVTPLASSLYLNLGAVTRERAILTDDLSRTDRERALAQADGFLRRALAADSSDPAIWRNLAEVAIARGDVGRARDYLAEARTRTSLGDAYALFQLGRISRDAGQWDEAARAWREGQAVGALQAWAQEARGREQWDRAATALTAVAELRPTDAPTFQQLTQTLRRARGDDAAIEELQSLGSALPRSPLPYVELANLYAERGQLQEATTARQEAERRASRQ